MHLYESPQRLGNNLPCCHPLSISLTGILPCENQTTMQRRSRLCRTPRGSSSRIFTSVLGLVRTALPPPAPLAWTLHLRQHILSPVAHQIVSQLLSTFSLYVEEKKEKQRKQMQINVYDVSITVLTPYSKDHVRLVMTCRSPKQDFLWCQ